jgi:hypothetical protein
MANPFVKISPDPLWLNADGIPDALSARRPISSGRDGAPGVVRRADFAVTFNAGMGVTITGGEAFVKGGNVTNQGMYYCYGNAASYNITVNNAPGAGTSRIDQVVLRVFDDPHDGSGLSEGRIEIIEGVPQATADLDQNRDAAAANLTTLGSPPSKSVLLLADILVTGGASSLSAGVIRDRRRYASEGGVSALKNTNDTYVEMCAPRPHPGMPVAMRSVAYADYGSHQSAALVWLDRGISANKLIFTYRNDAVAASPGTYMAAVCDPSGRVIFNANGQTLGSNATTKFHDVMTMPLTQFDAGYYWYVFGMSGAAGANPIYYWAMHADVGTSGNPSAVVQTPNVFLWSATGAATFPATKNILGYTDAYGSSSGALPVPLFVLAR